MNNKELLKGWEITEKIGEGQLGEVYKANKVVNGIKEECAIKYICLPKSDEELNELIRNGTIKGKNKISNYYNDILKNIETEIKIMEEFNGNPYMIDCYEHEIIKNDNPYKVEICIRLELAEDIETYFNNCDDSNKETDVIKMAIDICTALEYCLEKNIIHKDIKPENIFYGKDKIFKLGDFSISGASNDKITGTIAYMSPDVFDKTPPNQTTDIYSLGLVMYKILNHNKLPFETVIVNSTDATKIRLNGKKIRAIKGVSPELMKIILKACEFEPEKRFILPSLMRAELTNIYNKLKKDDDEDNVIDKTVSVYSTNELGLDNKKKLLNKIKKNNIINKFKNKLKIIIAIIILIIIILLTLKFCGNNTIECEEGYVQSGDTCVEGYYTCSDNYVLNEDNKCVTVIATTAPTTTTSCPDNFVISETGYCVYTDTASLDYQYTCSNGTLSGSKCIISEKVAAVPTYSCSNKNYTLTGTSCVKTETNSSYVQYTCSDGSTSSTGYCDETSEPTSWVWGYGTCSTGTYNYLDKLCHNTVSATKTCSNSSYTYNGTTCVKTTTTSANVSYSCAVGTLSGKYCIVKVETTPSVSYGCPDGYTLTGSVCVKQEIEEITIEYSCPNDYTLNEETKACEKFGNEKEPTIVEVTKTEEDS